MNDATIYDACRAAGALDIPRVVASVEKAIYATGDIDGVLAEFKRNRPECFGRPPKARPPKLKTFFRDRQPQETRSLRDEKEARWQ